MKKNGYPEARGCIQRVEGRRRLDTKGSGTHKPRFTAIAFQSDYPLIEE